jgi:hypothetical protein
MLLDSLQDGTRINFVLNTLSLIDIGIWKNKYLKDLLTVMNDFIDEPHHKNNLMLSSNPL